MYRCCKQKWRENVEMVSRIVGERLQDTMKAKRKREWHPADETVKTMSFLQKGRGHPYDERTVDFVVQFVWKLKVNIQNKTILRYYSKCAILKLHNWKWPYFPAAEPRPERLAQPGERRGPAGISSRKALCSYNKTLQSRFLCCKARKAAFFAYRIAHAFEKCQQQSKQNPGGGWTAGMNFRLPFWKILYN